jgi:chromosome segregation ATPase
MKATEEEIQKLTNQLKDSGIQIAVLSAKFEAATVTAQKFGNELKVLQSTHEAATSRLRELELHKSGMYMWENIGDGG